MQRSEIVSIGSNGDAVTQRRMPIDNHVLVVLHLYTQMNRVPSPHKKEKKKLVAEYLMVCVTQSMIEQASTEYPVPPQLIIGDTLSMGNVPGHTK